MEKRKLSWLAAQCILCGILLLATLLLRLTDGETWDTVAALLQVWMYG